MNPPTVEGWHTGFEWIDSGTLSERIGFVEQRFGNQESPGISEMVKRIGSLDNTPVKLVESCLEVLGSIQVREDTYKSLVAYASELKKLNTDSGLHNLLQMTASTVDYQFA